MQLQCFLLLITLSLLSTFTSAYGGIHNFRAYTKSDGTVVEEHLSGNPSSNVHCHHDVCH